MSEHHKLSRKERKKLQLQKNRYQQDIYQALRLRRAEEARVESLSKKPKRNEEKKSEGPWSDKVSTIRNRLTDKRRDSAERWNRFSGTSDAGSRGL